MCVYRCTRTVCTHDAAENAARAALYCLIIADLTFGLQPAADGASFSYTVSSDCNSPAVLWPAILYL